MLALLSGVLARKEEDHVILDVQGVGYEVYLSPATIASLGPTGEKLRLEIHTHVSESAFQLYGFLSAQEKTLFKRLISVSGIGPKLASTMVSSMPFQDLVQAIVSEEVATLKGISGVGQKTAQRVVMELKDKFKDVSLDLSAIAGGVSSPKPLQQEAVQALVSLGYSEQAAKRAINQIPVESNDNIQTLIKKSLGALSQ